MAVSGCLDVTGTTTRALASVANGGLSGAGGAELSWVSERNSLSGSLHPNMLMNEQEKVVDAIWQ